MNSTKRRPLSDSGPPALLLIRKSDRRRLGSPLFSQFHRPRRVIDVKRWSQQEKGGDTAEDFAAVGEFFYLECAAQHAAHSIAEPILHHLMAAKVAGPDVCGRCSRGLGR